MDNLKELRLAILIDADKVDGFCIVSSDSDFTRLAIRLREAGMKVIGIGEKKTPTPFITACDKFIYIEILKAASLIDTIEPKKLQKEKTKSLAVPLNKLDNNIINLLADSIADLADESGWTFLGDLGNFILKRKPDFDPRNYGFSKMLLLIKSLKRFEIDERETGKNNIKHIYVRVK